jgi:F0F1-type ATP synthase delta subunit
MKKEDIKKNIFESGIYFLWLEPSFFTEKTLTDIIKTDPSVYFRLLTCCHMYKENDFMKNLFENFSTDFIKLMIEANNTVKNPYVVKNIPDHMINREIIAHIQKYTPQDLSDERIVKLLKKIRLRIY